MTHTAENDAPSALTVADIKALGDAVLIAQALRQAASDVEEECSAQAVPCFCGSAKWLRARAERIARVIPPQVTAP